MRGKAQSPKMRIVHNRITPAYAGKSDFCRNARVDFEDHPRLCGEKPDFFPRSVLLWGSPPPMRGKENVLFCTLPGVQDHPRLCGEKRMLKSFASIPTGSPPPMRGKVAVSTSNGSRHRITPAYAGKRRHLHRSRYRGRDHPRLCGEKFNHA